MLFSDRSILTMVHGIVLGGASLMALSAALFSLYTVRTSGGRTPSDGEARALGGLAVFIAVTLWITVLVGTGSSSSSTRSACWSRPPSTRRRAA
jgi:hypothetical protein